MELWVAKEEAIRVKHPDQEMLHNLRISKTPLYTTLLLFRTTSVQEKRKQLTITTNSI
jgi:hypothetical protein